MQEANFSINGHEVTYFYNASKLKGLIIDNLAIILSDRQGPGFIEYGNSANTIYLQIFDVFEVCHNDKISDEIKHIINIGHLHAASCMK